MRLLRNMLAFNYGFWIAAFFCLLSVGCVSPVKEEAVPQKKVEAYDEIRDRMLPNVVKSDDTDLEKPQGEVVEHKNYDHNIETGLFQGGGYAGHSVNPSRFLVARVGEYDSPQTSEMTFEERIRILESRMVDLNIAVISLTQARLEQLEGGNANTADKIIFMAATISMIVGGLIGYFIGRRHERKMAR